MDADLPYPEPTDRIQVAVYCRKTGAILKVVGCALQDAHRQHAEHPEHDYIDTTGRGAHPDLHSVAVGTRELVLRTRVNAGDKALKRHELQDAMNRALPEVDLTVLLLAVAGGEEGAKELAQQHTATRRAATEKLTRLLAAVESAATLAELAAISWD